LSTDVPLIQLGDDGLKVTLGDGGPHGVSAIAQVDTVVPIALAEAIPHPNGLFHTYVEGQAIYFVFILVATLLIENRHEIGRWCNGCGMPWHTRASVRFLAMNKFLPKGRDLRKLGVY
jgi:hypothetical protein